MLLKVEKTVKSKLKTSVSGIEMVDLFICVLHLTTYLYQSVELNIYQCADHIMAGVD